MTKRLKKALDNKNSEYWKMLEAQDGKCCYCGVKICLAHIKNNPQGPSKEHLRMRAFGGKTELGNIRISCRDCNSGRGTRTWIEWKSIRMGEFDELARVRSVTE